MKNSELKTHWERVYQSRPLEAASWFEPKPATSLEFFKKFNIPATAKIIDVGGGDSLLADYLLDLGYQDITVLDISEVAIERAKKRLGNAANRVKWIVADAVNFKPDTKYDFWHDRAAFHFLTEETDIDTYLKMVHNSIQPDGVLVIGTFSEQGPKKCSGLDVKQYSETSMTERMTPLFNKVECINMDHLTPEGAIQNFIFCGFTKSVVAGN